MVAHFPLQASHRGDLQWIVLIIFVVCFVPSNVLQDLEDVQCCYLVRLDHVLNGHEHERVIAHCVSIGRDVRSPFSQGEIAVAVPVGMCVEGRGGCEADEDGRLLAGRRRPEPGRARAMRFLLRANTGQKI